MNDAALDVYYVIRQSNRWFWLMAILGFAMEHLNRKSKYLAQANEMVYPFYILHQTVIVALAFYLMQVEWSIGLKFTFISLSTFILCFLLVRYVIMPINWLRVPFGLKPVQKRNVAASKVTAREIKVAS